MKKNSLINQKFSRLTVVAESDPINHRTAWLCVCDCGNTKIIKSEHLIDGTTKSCGCLNIEKRTARAKHMYSANIKYHPSKTSARRVWRTRYNNGISFEDFFELSQKPCYYCGSLPNNMQNVAKEDKKSSQYAKDNGDFIYNGLDRVDNAKPHIIDNCVPCCKWCNFAKRERSVEEFKIWIKRLYENIFVNN